MASTLATAELTAAIDGSIFHSTPQDRLSRVGLRVPSYIGQRVEIVRGPTRNVKLPRDLAEVIGVNRDGSVSVRFFDASQGAYGESIPRGARVCVEGEDDCYLVPKIVAMQDAAMMLADEALVKAGYISLNGLAALWGVEPDMDPWDLVPLRWFPTYVDGQRKPNGLILDPRGACHACQSESDGEESDGESSEGSESSESSESEVGLNLLAILEQRQLWDSWQSWQSDDGYIPPKLVDAKRRKSGCPTPTLRYPQCPPLTRAVPVSAIRGHFALHGCTECGDPSLCTELSFDHFQQRDHPPSRQFGPHPYIVVPEAEDAGADMRQARELLGKLESAGGFDRNGALLSGPHSDGGSKLVPVGLEEWEAYIYSRTHRVPAAIQSGDPAGAWAALQEALRMGHDISELERAYGEERWRLFLGAKANRRAVAEMKRVLSDKGATPATEEPRPQFLRVAERAMRRKKAMRQAYIDWPAQRRKTRVPNPMDTK
ncbi:hypothetical protein OAO87_03720 [bacterium]|nr:hypothetical protein [bacterium]